MVGKVKMGTNWSVKFGCSDGRSVPVEAFFECSLGFPYILDFTNPASNEIYNISSGTSDVAHGLVREVGGFTGEVVAFVNVYVTYNASIAGALEGSMLCGRRMVSE